jgi:xanthine dehydrogenase accessory factor
MTDMADDPVVTPPSSRADGWQVLRQAARMADAGAEFALATVVWRQGPSSGQPGARAVITADGEVHGWIGGACAEPAVIREAQDVIRSRSPRLLLLGTAQQFAGAVPDGMRAIPISCQSEGALEVYIEPVVPAPHLVVVGRSPMAQTLVELASVVDWNAELVDAADLDVARITARTAVVIATQGHGDEEAVERVLTAVPAYVGLVASAKRGQAVVGYLADRGVPREDLDRVVAPVGLDLGHTSHREIAVSILAELVRLRAAGALGGPATAPSGHGSVPGRRRPPGHQSAAMDPPTPDTANAQTTLAIDPVCGMTVRADGAAHHVEHDGVNYYFCCVGCRDAFVADPAAYLPDAAHPAGREV